MLGVRVQGGTDAGRRRPLKEPAQAWQCPRCTTGQPGHATRCLTSGCNEKRPS